MWFVFVIPFVMFFVVFLFIAKNLFKSHKVDKDTMQNMIEKDSIYNSQPEVTNEYAPADSEQVIEIKDKEFLCDYCGKKVNPGQTACSSCGARLNSNNK